MHMPRPFEILISERQALNHNQINVSGRIIILIKYKIEFLKSLLHFRKKLPRFLLLNVLVVTCHAWKAA